MTDSNSQKARWLFDLLNKRAELPLDQFDPDFELVSPIASVSGNSFRGHEGLRRWESEVAENFEHLTFALDETREAGERVLALGHIHLRGRGSGIELDQPAAWLVEFRDEKVLKAQTFLQQEEAIAAFEARG